MGKSLKTQDRNLKYCVDKILIEEGFVRTPLLALSVNAPYSWDISLVYEKLKTEGIAIIRYQDESLSDPGDDYVGTKISVKFFQMKENVRKGIEDVLKKQVSIKSKRTYGVKHNLSKLGFK